MKNYIYILLVFIFFISSCNDVVIQPKEYPLVITKEVTNIDVNGVTFDAEILIKGTEKIIDFGYIVNNGVGNGKSVLKLSVFNSNKFKTRVLTDLKANVAYTCRAYVKTEKRLVYGNSVDFVALGSATPLISDFNPKSGYDGDTVKLTGKYFSSIKDNNQVYVNNKVAQIIANTDSSIVFITPYQSYIGAVDITLEVNTSKVRSNQKFTIIGPEITSILPSSATSGKIVTITGTNLIRNGNNINVKFNQYSAEILNYSNTSIDVIVPIPTYSLLTDTYTIMEFANGLKSVNYPFNFIIKKSWQIKSPPLLFNWPTNYQDGFTYNEKGYIHEVNHGSMYEYNPTTDSWKQYAEYQLTIYSGSLYIPVDNQIFRVGGIDYLNQPVNYLWSFSPATNKWTQKNNLPFSFSIASYFILENQVYILTYEGQLWQCDFIGEHYKRLKDFPVVLKDFFVSTFIANGNAYAVQYGHTWLYDKESDKWIEKAANMFSKGYYSVSAKCFTCNNTGYVLADGTDLYKYDFINDKWVLKTKYPNEWGSNSKKSIFVIQNEAYIAATSSNYVDGAPFMYLYLGQ